MYHDFRSNKTDEKGIESLKKIAPDKFQQNTDELDTAPTLSIEVYLQAIHFVVTEASYDTTYDTD